MNAKLSIIGTVKQTVRDYRSSKNPIIRLGISLFYFFMKSIFNFRRFCVDQEFRSIILLQLLNSKNVHQTTPFTYMDRYPFIFSACRDYLKNKKELRILSYGCSTGEEVLTLRKFFPDAQIIGAEINKRSLAICKQHKVDDKISFIHSTDVEINNHGPYDVIFCMAVLQRKPHYIAEKGIRSLKKIYPFEKFEEQILKLDQLVKTDGLLVVHYTQYAFMDTSIVSKYKALGNYNQGNTSPLFDRNSNLIKNAAPQKSIYIKVV